jgi:SulP family sulfate permease
MAPYLEQVPMACTGGILLYVSSGMVKGQEVKEVLAMNKFHIALMIYTAIMVPVAGFMTAVVSAILLYAVLHRWLDRGHSEKGWVDAHGTN